MFLSLSTVFMLDHFTRLSYLLIVCVCMVYRIHLLTRQSLVGVCWLRVICACRYSVCCMYGWIACLLCLIGLVRGGRFELRTFSFMMKGQCCASRCTFSLPDEATSIHPVYARAMHVCTSPLGGGTGKSNAARVLPSLYSSR